MKTKKPFWMQSIPGAIAIGELTGMLLTLIGAAIIASLINSTKLGEDGMRYGVLIVLLCASFLTAMVSAALAQKRRMLVCLAAGIGYGLVLIALTALFFGGQYQGVMETFLVILAGSIGCGLVGLRGKRKQQSRRQWKLNR